MKISDGGLKLIKSKVSEKGNGCEQPKTRLARIADGEVKKANLKMFFIFCQQKRVKSERRIRCRVDKKEVHRSVSCVFISSLDLSALDDIDAGRRAY